MGGKDGVTVIELFFTGGFSASDENVAVDGLKYIKCIRMQTFEIYEK